MPTTITSTSGNTYHLFQLAEASYWEPEESIRFEELENDLGDGYFSQALYGANTGLRRWKLKLPTLAHTDVLPNTVTDVSGATVSREEYLWNLFCHTKVTGEPFVFRSPRNGQYYLVRFADKDLSYQKMRVKIYSTGVELKQVRVPGDSVFSLPDILSSVGADIWINETSHDSLDWDAVAGSGAVGGTGSGDIIYAGSTQNGNAIVRFNSVSDTGLLEFPQLSLGTTGFDLFLVMKMRESTFANNYVLHQKVGTIDTQIPGLLLAGDTGTTKFVNDGHNTAEIEYRLNGTEYAYTNMQAPMGAWGIVHLHTAKTFGVTVTPTLQLGRFAGVADGAVDVGEMILVPYPLPQNSVDQITEHLTVKWGIT